MIFLFIKIIDKQKRPITVITRANEYEVTNALLSFYEIPEYMVFQLWLEKAAM